MKINNLNILPLVLIDIWLSINISRLDNHMIDVGSAKVKYENYFFDNQAWNKSHYTMDQGI